MACVFGEVVCPSISGQGLAPLFTSPLTGRWDKTNVASLALSHEALPQEGAQLMLSNKVKVIATMALCVALGCSDDDDDKNNKKSNNQTNVTNTMATGTGTGTGTSMNTGTGMSTSTGTMSSTSTGTSTTQMSLFQRLGGEKGLTEAVDAVVVKELADPEIALYFSTALLGLYDGGADAGAPGPNADQVKRCLVLQLAAATGEPGYTYPVKLADAAPLNGYQCRDMKSSHDGLGIDGASFDKFVMIAGTTLTAAEIAPDDVTVVAGVLNGTKPDIADLKDTLFDRLNGDEGITKVVNEIVKRVTMDPDSANAMIFSTAFADATGPTPEQVVRCFVVQLSTASGGVGYVYPASVGKEPGELGTKTGMYTCRDMKAAHAGLGITKDDFKDFMAIAGAVLADLKASKDIRITDADIPIIAKVLTDTEGDVVETQ